MILLYIISCRWARTWSHHEIACNNQCFHCAARWLYAGLQGYNLAVPLRSTTQRLHTHDMNFLVTAGRNYKHAKACDLLRHDRYIDIFPLIMVFTKYALPWLTACIWLFISIGMWGRLHSQRTQNDGFFMPVIQNVSWISDDSPDFPVKNTTSASMFS